MKKICLLLTLVMVFEKRSLAQNEINPDLIEKILIMGPQPVPSLRIVSLKNGRETDLSSIKSSDLRYPERPTLIFTFDSAAFGATIPEINMLVHGIDTSKHETRQFNIISIFVDDEEKGSAGYFPSDSIQAALSKYALFESENFRVSRAEYSKSFKEAKGVTPLWLIVDKDYKVQDYCIGPNPSILSVPLMNAFYRLEHGKYASKFVDQGKQYVNDKYLYWQHGSYDDNTSQLAEYYTLDKNSNHYTLSHYAKGEVSLERFTYAWLYSQKTFKIQDGTLVADGIVKHWSAGGVLASEFNVTNGKLTTGKMYSNGDTISVQYNLSENGDGYEKQIYENGQVKRMINYKNGKAEGSVKTYYNSGKLWSVVAYKNGKLEGPFVQYYESGKFKVNTGFKNDVADGQYTEYYEDGKVRNEGVFINGLQEGTEKQYDYEGVVVETLEFKGGKLNGFNMKYYHNGNKYMEIPYLNDEKNGEVKVYDKTGKLIRTEKYENGKFISTTNVN